MSSTAEDYFATGDGEADDSFKDYLKAMAIVDRPDFGESPSQQHQIQVQHQSSIKKCSRCRMKRIHESEMDLHKYQTCAQCRAKRKVKERRPRQLTKLPNVSDNWSKFLSKVSLNHQIDLYQHNFRAFTDPAVFPRYKPEELNMPIIQEIGEKIIQTYIIPLQGVSGFKFAIRDHHNPQLTDLNKAKKITWMYICSQDRTRRRKSRSENKRQIVNKLKTEDCESKINLSYDIVNGIIQMSYNHKHHKPSNGVIIKSTNSPSSPILASTSAVQQTSSANNVNNGQLIPINDDIYTNLPDDKSIHQQFQELQKQHQLLQTEEEEEQRFYDSKDVVNVANAAIGGSTNGSTDVEVSVNSSSTNSNSRGEEGGVLTRSHHHHHHHHSVDSFDSINIGIDDDNYDDNGNGTNVDVDVAEIAKLLKQVQQSTSVNGNTNNNNKTSQNDHDHHQSNLGLEEIASLVGLGPDDLSLLNDSSSYSVNQNILEQVREQVRKGQANREEAEEELDEEETVARRSEQ